MERGHVHVCICADDEKESMGWLTNRYIALLRAWYVPVTEMWEHNHDP